jgi:hypothetical protein
MGLSGGIPFVGTFVICEHDVESDRMHLLAAIKGGDPGLSSAW